MESKEVRNELRGHASESASDNNPCSRLTSFARKNPKRASLRKRGTKNATKHAMGQSEDTLFVITRPKGGKKAMCMDLQEVKACQDLGFELENETMMEIPTRVTSPSKAAGGDSGENSPILRIPNLGDNPRDVKATLKIWAQAVALASRSGKMGE